MRKGTIVYLVVIALALTISISSGIGYDSGYARGYDDGNHDGYDVGYDDGYDSGYTKGQKSVSASSNSSYKTWTSPSGNTTLTQQPTVYITETGTKYHQSWCSYLKSSIPVYLSTAKESGYTPCSRCNPPT